AIVSARQLGCIQWTAPGAASAAASTAGRWRMAQASARFVCATVEGVRRPTIAAASWTNSSFSIDATMNRAKSTRRVMLLSRIGSPTCRLHDDSSERRRSFDLMTAMGVYVGTVGMSMWASDDGGETWARPYGRGL